MSNGIMKIGDRETVVKTYTGKDLVQVGRDEFARPCDLPSGRAVVRETYEFVYEFPNIRERPRWQIVSVELDPASLDPAPPPAPDAPSWIARLWAWLTGRRPALPEARVVDR